MESNINPFVKLKIYVVNDKSELVMKGMNKIIVVFNRLEITNYSQFVEKLNEIYSDYGVVEKISDKDGFRIMNLNNLQINNIWNYLSNNDITYVTLTDKKHSLSSKNENNINLKQKYDIANSYFKLDNSSKREKSYSNNINNNYHKSMSSSSSSSQISSSHSKNKNVKKTFVEVESSFSSSTKKKISHNLSNCSEKSNESDSSEKDDISLNKSEIFKRKKKESSFKEIKKDNFHNFKALGKKRKLNEKNFKENYNYNKKRKLENLNTNTRYKKKNNQNNNNSIKNKKINYKLIPSDKLDDVTFLKSSYPKLFNQGTNIKFKIQELLEKGIGVGDYHKGVIEDFNLENKSFLIKNCNCDSMNEKTKIFMYQYDDDLMFVELKNFVELWIEKENNEEVNDVNDMTIDVDIDKNDDLSKHFIKRQIEYYFSDDNYQKDSYLKSKEDENGFIPISVIMSFNKIKMITTNKDLFVNALMEKDNENDSEKGNKNKLYELNDDLTKIRKIKLNFN